MKTDFKDSNEREALRADMEAQGLVIRQEHLNTDGSGYIVCLDAAESVIARNEAFRLELQSTDSGLARGLEDLIDLLEVDGMNIRARLPQELQDKLARRVILRDFLSE